MPTMPGKIAGALIVTGLGAMTLSGCGGGGCHNNNVAVSWTVVDASNNVFHCEDVGAATVVMNMGGMSTSFSCNQYQGVTASVRAGTYSTSFQLLDAGGNVLSQAPAMDVTVSGCGTINVGQIDFEVTPACATQDVSLTWTIVQDATNQPLTCQDVGAGTVRLNLGTNTFNFDCGAAAGRTTAVPGGTYPTSVQLFDLNGGLLSQTSSMNVIVPHCAGVTLPNIEFGVQ